MEEQAQILKATNAEEAAKIQKRIVKAEEIKQMYLKLRRYLKPQGRSSVNQIMVPDNDLPPKVAQLWRSVYDPVVLKALLIKCNRKHFAQAENAPFMKDILGMIPFSGTGPIADSILDGSITVDDPVVQLVLDNLKRPEGLNETNIAEGHPGRSHQQIQKLERDHLYISHHKMTPRPLSMLDVTY